MSATTAPEFDQLLAKLIHPDKFGYWHSLAEEQPHIAFRSLRHFERILSVIDRFERDFIDKPEYYDIARDYKTFGGKLPQTGDEHFRIETLHYGLQILHHIKLIRRMENALKGNELRSLWRTRAALQPETVGGEWEALRDKPFDPATLYPDFSRRIFLEHYADLFSHTAISSVFNRESVWLGLNRSTLTPVAPSSLDTLKAGNRVGVELELFGISDQRIPILKLAMDVVLNGWRESPDRSIVSDDGTRGIEMVSPILTKDTIGQLEASIRLIHGMGGKAGPSCAMHMHSCMTDFPEALRGDLMRQIVINYCALEEDLAFLDRPVITTYERVFAGQSRTMDQGMRAVLDTTCLDDLIRVSQGGDRNSARVNFYSMSKYGTAEFRHHPGTADPYEVTAWVKFLDHFVAQSVEMVKRHGGAHMPNTEEKLSLRKLVYKLKSERKYPEPAHESTGPIFGYYVA